MMDNGGRGGTCHEHPVDKMMYTHGSGEYREEERPCLQLRSSTGRAVCAKFGGTLPCRVWALSTKRDSKFDTTKGDLPQRILPMTQSNSLHGGNRSTTPRMEDEEDIYQRNRAGLRAAHVSAQHTI